MVCVACRLASFAMRCSVTMEAHKAATRNAITRMPCFVMAAMGIDNPILSVSNCAAILRLS